MEPISIITSAITLATPYLIKSGEAIAKEIGEDIWKIIKKPFIKDNESKFNIDINQQEEKDKLIHLLLDQISKDNNYKEELENAVLQGQKLLNDSYQQNIKNNGMVQKQINIQQNNGNIQM